MNEDIASIIANLREHVDMDHNCGYITIIKLKKKTHQPSSSNQKKDDKPPLSPFNSKVILENANLVRLNMYLWKLNFVWNLDPWYILAWRRACISWPSR